MTNRILQKLIKTRSVLLFFILLTQTLAQAQNGTRITGRVLDAKGESLIGVTVSQVDNPRIATVTDMSGTYVLTLPEPNVSLKFTYLGYKDKIVKVGKELVIDVVLDENVSALNEVVVVGYGTQKKVSVIGSVAAIDNKELYCHYLRHALKPRCR